LGRTRENAEIGRHSFQIGERGGASVSWEARDDLIKIELHPGRARGGHDRDRPAQILVRGQWSGTEGRESDESQNTKKRRGPRGCQETRRLARVFGLLGIPADAISDAHRNYSL
jgi:hypothetical protein